MNKRSLIFLFIILSMAFSACKKHDVTPPTNGSNGNSATISDSTIVVSNSNLTKSLIAVDSTDIVFTAGGTGVNRIKVGSILVSDVSTLAPDGFLRRVTSISTSNGKTICTTEQASLADAIENCNIQLSEVITDSNIVSIDSSGVDITARLRNPLKNNYRMISFSQEIPFDTAIYDADDNYQTTNDQIRLLGGIRVKTTLTLILQIKHFKVVKFLIEAQQKDTEEVKAESQVSLLNFDLSKVLYTFKLPPFRFPVGPPPVTIPVVITEAIPIEVGIKGSVTGTVSGGVQNTTYVDAGLDYENDTWQTIDSSHDDITLEPLTFSIAAEVEPYIELRYELRPYGIKEARLYLAADGSFTGSATVNSSGLTLGAAWGVELSGAVKMNVWDRNILDYEKTFWQKSFPINIPQPNIFAYPTLTTSSPTNISSTTATCGGNVTWNGGTPITQEGVCWSTSQNPTIQDNIATSTGNNASFTVSLNNLSPGTTYYARAFATNSAGTGYGNEVTLTTEASGPLPEPTNLWTFDDCTTLNSVDSSYSDYAAHGYNTYVNSIPCVTGINSHAMEISNAAPSFYTQDWTPDNFSSNKDLEIYDSAFTICFWVKFVQGDTNQIDQFAGIITPSFFTLGTESGNGLLYFTNIYKCNIYGTLLDCDQYKLPCWAVQTTGPNDGKEVNLYTDENFNDLVDGNWHQLALSCKSGTMSFYLDGTLRATFPSPSSHYNSIQAWPDFDHNIYYDQIRIYNVALTQSQIQYIYNEHL